MNKKTITALSIGAVAIIGASILGCDGFGFNKEDIKTDGAKSAAEERKAGKAKYQDGNYTFYFKNGKNVSGDCDGYSSDVGGSTTIYEWSKSDINEWEKRLNGAGISTTIWRTSMPTHCWVRFNTDSLIGTGWTGAGSVNIFHDPEVNFITREGKQLSNLSADFLHYARPGESFHVDSNIFKVNNAYKEKVNEISHAKNGFAGLGFPTILISFFNSNRKDGMDKVLKAFKDAGIPEQSFLIRKDWDDSFNCIEINANYVRWFAFDL